MPLSDNMRYDRFFEAIAFGLVLIAHRPALVLYVVVNAESLSSGSPELFMPTGSRKATGVARIQPIYAERPTKSRSARTSSPWVATRAAQRDRL
jgi:hypothetical protein